MLMNGGRNRDTWRHCHNLTSLLSASTAMWSMPVVLTETDNENDSANQ